LKSGCTHAVLTSLTCPVVLSLSPASVSRGGATQFSPPDMSPTPALCLADAPRFAESIALRAKRRSRSAPRRISSTAGPIRSFPAPNTKMENAPRVGIESPSTRRALRGRLTARNTRSKLGTLPGVRVSVRLETTRRNVRKECQKSVRLRSNSIPGTSGEAARPPESGSQATVEADGGAEVRGLRFRPASLRGRSLARISAGGLGRFEVSVDVDDEVRGSRALSARDCNSAARSERDDRVVRPRLTCPIVQSRRVRHSRSGRKDDDVAQ
jgi:hypothetical protein